MDGPGQTIAERYELVRVAGSGGMATVWKAMLRGAEGFARPVCIKRIREPLSFDDDFRAMFVEEARVSASLVHPNIVQTIDFGVDDERYFLVMEWVEGMPLGRFLNLLRELEEPLPWPLVAAIGIEALRGLEAAHIRVSDDGLVSPVYHRDVTPQNILLSEAGVVKLTDFGLARAMDRVRITATNVVKGKVGYLAPELVKGCAASPQTDLFSLGVVLWQSLAGRRLYTGRTDAEVMAAARDGDIPPISEMRDDVPTRLAATVDRALASDPGDRFESARQMGRVLARLLRPDAGQTEARHLAPWVQALMRFEKTGVRPELSSL
ncbi:MAG: serine/threonine-protein kinase [Myxococcota bacterium]